jgi:hypothetical protein
MSMQALTAEASLYKTRIAYRILANSIYLADVGEGLPGKVTPARATRQVCLPIVRCSHTACWVEPCGIVVVVPDTRAEVL